MKKQYEEIEYFKRFSKCYLLWAFSNFDRIVIDAVQRQERIKAEEDEAKRINAPAMRKIRELFRVTNEQSNKWAMEAMKDNAFYKGAQWDANFKIGQTLKIKLPETFKEPMEPSYFRRVLSSLPLMKGRFP